MSKIIEDAHKMLAAYKLKFTYRWTERTFYNGQKESVAAHTWGMMLVADYLLERLHELAPNKYQLNREKIYSLIAYHDLIEAETGDIDLNPSLGRNHSQKGEKKKKALTVFP